MEQYDTLRTCEGGLLQQAKRLEQQEQHLQLQQQQQQQVQHNEGGQEHVKRQEKVRLEMQKLELTQKHHLNRCMKTSEQCETLRAFECELLQQAQRLQQQEQQLQLQQRQQQQQQQTFVEAFLERQKQELQVQAGGFGRVEIRIQRLEGRVNQLVERQKRVIIWLLYC